MIFSAPMRRKVYVIDLARGRDVELGLVLRRRREIELPEHDQRIERRQLQRRRLVVVQQDHAGFPVEVGRLAPVAAGALDAVARRLQSVGGDRALALRPRLAGEQQRGQPARLADGRDAVLAARVLEAVDGVADQETARAEERAIGEIDARRQFAAVAPATGVAGIASSSGGGATGSGAGDGSGNGAASGDDFGCGTLDRDRRRDGHDAAMLGLGRCARFNRRRRRRQLGDRRQQRRRLVDAVGRGETAIAAARCAPQSTPTPPPRERARRVAGRKMRKMRCARTCWWELTGFGRGIAGLTVKATGSSSPLSEGACSTAGSASFAADAHASAVDGQAGPRRTSAPRATSSRCSTASTRAASVASSSSSLHRHGACATIGPRSTSEVTKCTVQPWMRTPSASARRWVSTPG